MPSKYPAIPEYYANQPASLEQTICAMREAVEILCGHRGSSADRAVRYGEFTGNDTDAPTNPYATLVGLAEAAAADTSVDWDEIVNIPASFPPAAHTHVTSEITDLAAFYAGFALLAGAVFSGKVTTAASDVALAGLNVPPGAAPAAPVQGDLWATADGLYYLDGTARTRALGRWTEVYRTTLSGLTTADFINLQAYSEVVLRLEGVSCSGAGATLQLLCSADNVSFFSSGYLNLEHGQTDAAVPAGYTTGVAATTYIGPNTTMLSSAAGVCSGMYHIFAMGMADMFGNFELANHGATRGHFNGYFKGPTSDVMTALRLQFSAGTFDAGTAVLLGR